ncbi:alpha/beta hydrolase [Fluviicola sp.]|uniref:alpha/beta hydrolase n=1 Tax=Fluviicola sp. TaxID=1917219 RepID=UPI0031D57BC0
MFQTGKILSSLIILLFVSLKAEAQMDDHFYFPSKDWKEIDSVKVKELKQKAGEETVTAYLLSNVAKPKATIIYFHGAGGNVSNYVQFVRPLLKDSFQLFMVDLRGYGKSTGKPTHLNVASDGQIMFDLALRQKEIKNTKIILCGVSMGTQVAAHLAAGNESKLTALILDGTIASFTDIAVATSDPKQENTIRQFIVSPYSAKEDIGKLTKIPVLFVHSKEDSGVPFAQYELVEANCVTKHDTLVYTGEHLEGPLVDPEKYVLMVNQLLKN